MTCTHEHREIADDVELIDDELSLTGVVVCRDCAAALELNVGDCLALAERFKGRLSEQHPLCVLARGAEGQLAQFSDETRAYISGLTLVEWEAFWQLVLAGCALRDLD